MGEGGDSGPDANSALVAAILRHHGADDVSNGRDVRLFHCASDPTRLAFFSRPELVMPEQGDARRARLVACLLALQPVSHAIQVRVAPAKSRRSLSPWPVLNLVRHEGEPPPRFEAFVAGEADRLGALDLSVRTIEPAKVAGFCAGVAGVVAATLFVYWLL